METANASNTSKQIFFSTVVSSKFPDKKIMNVRDVLIQLIIVPLQYFFRKTKLNIMNCLSFKNKYLCFIGIVIVLSSCSSPEKEGIKAGLTFCDCMKGKISADDSPFSLFSLRDSCKSIMNKTIKQAEEKYKTDAAKLLELKTAYLNTSLKTYLDFQEALSKSIGKSFSKQIWVKEDETSTENCLFSFAANKITPLNERGEFEFTLLGDTMKIDDGKELQLLIYFHDSGRFSLSNLEESSKVNYRAALTNQDKLIGFWKVSSSEEGATYNFKSDKSFYCRWFSSCEHYGKYSWTGDEITFNGYIDNYFGKSPVKLNDKLIIEDINKILLPSIIKRVLGGVRSVYCCDFSLTRKKSNKVLSVSTLYRN